MAADIGADVQRARLALEQLHRGEERTLRTAGAQTRRPGRNESREAPGGHEPSFPGGSGWSDASSGAQLRHPARNELSEPLAQDIDRVLAVHRQYVLAQKTGGDVVFAQDLV